MSSYYEDLKVYKKSIELTCYFENVVTYFNKKHKYGIGLDLRNSSRKLTFTIARANTAKFRIQGIKEALEILEELKIHIRIAQEINVFNRAGSAGHAIGCVIDLSKQCEGWLKESQRLGIS